MRVYDGSPRQDFEEVLRSVGAVLDQRGMREISVLEVPDGFIVQGIVTQVVEGGWSDTIARQEKESLSVLEDDIARFMEEAHARRGLGAQAQAWQEPAGSYERSLRVIGHYIDEQKPRDVFLFEQDGAYVLRLLMATQSGPHHLLVEFTRDEIEQLIVQAPLRRAAPAAVSPPSGRT